MRRTPVVVLVAGAVSLSAFLAACRPGPILPLTPQTTTTTTPSSG